MKYLLLLATVYGCATLPDDHSESPQPLPVEAPSAEPPEESCKRPEVVNRTAEWDEFDEWNLRSTFSGCRRKYTELHCPRTFYKVAPQIYRVICYKVEE